MKEPKKVTNKMMDEIQDLYMDSQYREDSVGCVYIECLYSGDRKEYYWNIYRVAFVGNDNDLKKTYICERLSYTIMKSMLINY